MSYSQWARTDSGAYTPVGQTASDLPPGYYDLASSNGQLFFVPIRARNDELLRFPDSPSLEVIETISQFWQREDMFKRYGLPFKRGVLLHGPPGGGKSATCQLVAREVVAKGGVVINFAPSLFLDAYRALRDIQPDMPVVVLMEDLEALFKKTDESRLLNLLDGAEELDKVVFLATTNYPELLEARISNRPSRFDIRIRVGHPSSTTRRIYLETLVKEGDHINVEQYVKDTEGWSLAHLKELFILTHIFAKPYDDAVAALSAMRDDKPDSKSDADTVDGTKAAVRSTGWYV